MKRSSAMKRLIATVNDIRSGKSIPPRGRKNRRKGSILIVVIALLGMLLLLGLAFYSFASQEQVSAEYFADSAKKTSDPGLSSDTLFDFAMEQLVVGPSQKLTQSALWGRRYSLVGTMLGTNANTVSTDPAKDGHFDTTLYNGQGINLALDGSNRPIVDQDYDGNPDNPTLMDINYSHGAQQAIGLSPAIPPSNPQPDVDYTYPDINNMFLAYISDSSNDVNGRRVIIPSFHRPQILRQFKNSPYVLPTASSSATKDDPLYWYNADGNVTTSFDYNNDGTSGNPNDPNDNLARRILRPHPAHKTASGVNNRFIKSGETIANVLGQNINPFPFAQDIDNDGVYGRMGVWTHPTEANPLLKDQYDLDSDNDGDGVNEGVWLDLDFPVQELPDGRKYVPLFSFTVLDADGLINLNTAGNLAGLLPSTNVFTDVNSSTHVSRSNFGASRSEVNPQWALYGNPATATGSDLDQYTWFWGGSPSTIPAMSNMDLFQIKAGRVEMASAGTPATADAYKVGLWGDLAMLQNASVNGPLANFPRPGQPNFDDDNDAAIGLAGYDPLTILPSSFPFPSVVHPFDVTGFGHAIDTSVAIGNGRKALLTSGSAGDPSRWLTYYGVQDPGSPPMGVTWSNWRAASLMQNPGWTAPMGSQDEADESAVEPALAGTASLASQAMNNDSLFGPEEMLGLHVSDNDFTNIAGTSRLQNLAPFNFKKSSDAIQIRKQFTTLSFDRAEFGKTQSAARVWETAGFPPSSLRAHYQTLLRNRLRLVLNGVLVGFENGQPLYRALTPHPSTGLSNSPVNYPSAVPLAEPPSYSGNAGLQEAYARYDRQSLARDIYQTLYLLGGGLHGTNYATTPTSLSSGPSYPLYSPAQLKEMAQFAVNLVDAMDRDNVITRFEYDTDLSNGWGLDDNPFTSGAGEPDRGEVFGVEAQQLTFSEWLCVNVPRSSTTDHPATRHVDNLPTPTPMPAWGYHYTYLELRNASPFPVELNNWGWRIRKAGLGGDRRLVLKGVSGATQIAAGSQYVIGSSNSQEKDNNGNDFPSDLRIDYDRNGSWNRIYPRVIETVESNIPTNKNQNPVTASDLDLITHYNSTTPTFLLVDASDNPVSTLGDFVNPASTPTGTEQITLVLERRLNLQRSVPSNKAADDADNPWIAVDIMEVPLNRAVQSLDLDMTTPANDTETALRFNSGITYPDGKIRKIVSHERKQPLNSTNETACNPTSGGTVPPPASLDFEPRCTLKFGPGNSVSPAKFDLWQPHFDREFTSTYDLLTIPLYGPNLDSILAFDPTTGAPVAGPTTDALSRLTTRCLALSNNMSAIPGNSTGTGANRGTEYTAAKKFLRPIYNNGTDEPSTLHINDSTYLIFDNRWHRALEVFDVPTRTNSSVHSDAPEDGVHHGETLHQWPNTNIPRRLPGALNLNTIRQPGVLAGLIDDPDGHMGIGSATPFLALNDTIESGTRNWWTQFVKMRDNIDPITKFYLPGLPDSRPYRSSTYAERRIYFEDVNRNGTLDPGEDRNNNNMLDQFMDEDVNQNGVLDTEDVNGNGVLDPGEDTIVVNGALDTEDMNRNGILDYDSSLQHTLLRDLAGLDRSLVPSQTQRNLFEARSQTDVSATDPVDYYTRHRLLRKIANNSTQRSNVFIVWVTVEFFEATEVATGEVRIGGKLANDTTRYRGFFVVDRSQLEKAISSFDPNGISFDFRKLIVHQKTLQ